MDLKYDAVRLDWAWRLVLAAVRSKIRCGETGLGMASHPSCSEKRIGENPCEFDISNFHTAWVIVCDPLLRQKQSRNKSGLANLNVDFFFFVLKRIIP